MLFAHPWPHIGWGNASLSHHAAAVILCIVLAGGMQVSCALNWLGKCRFFQRMSIGNESSHVILAGEMQVFSRHAAAMSLCIVRVKPGEGDVSAPLKVGLGLIVPLKSGGGDVFFAFVGRGWD